MGILKFSIKIESMVHTYLYEIEIITVLLYVLVALSFNAYFSASSRVFSRVLKKYPDEKAGRLRVYLQRISGMFFLGFMPLVLIYTLLPTTLKDYGSLLVGLKSTLLWALLFAMLIIPLILLKAKSTSNLAVYPQIRTNKWNLNILVLSGLTWIGYLLCYEFLFRGVLLFACQRAFGAVPAIVINILIYAIAHIPKGKFETIGAIPLGFILCVLTIETGSIWFAFLAHVIMALSNEWIALYHNKELELKIKF